MQDNEEESEAGSVESSHSQTGIVKKCADDGTDDNEERDSEQKPNQYTKTPSNAAHFQCMFCIKRVRAIQNQHCL